MYPYISISFMIKQKQGPSSRVQLLQLPDWTFPRRLANKCLNESRVQIAKAGWKLSSFFSA